MKMAEPQFGQANISPPHLRMDITESAMLKSLNITELLENILLYLDLRTLLLSARVSKTFKATIDDSTKCQKALFFQPLWQPNTEDLTSDQSAAHDTSKDDLNKGQEEPSTTTPNIAVINPLLYHLLEFDTFPYSDKVCSNVRMDVTSDELEQMIKSGVTESWSRMLVMQPQSAPVYLPRGTMGVSDQMVVRDGLRMPELLEFEEEGRTIDACVVEYEGTVQLLAGMKWALGRYDESLVPKGLTEEVASEICGWDVLSPWFGQECIAHLEYQEQSSDSDYDCLDDRDTTEEGFDDV